MAMSKQSITAEEIGRRGEALYNAGIRERVETGTNIGRFLALDVHSGDYAMDTDEHGAVQRAMEKNPDGMFYIIRIGSDVAHFVGQAVSEAME